MDKREFISRARLERQVKDKRETILSKVKEKRVLDVGCVGQAHGRGSGGWLHQALTVEASHVHGVDIVEEEVRRLNEEGFQIFLPEELEARESSYDVIVMGDVIEHVAAPVSFLDYYSRWLAEDGVMLVSTPNAFSILQVANILIGNGVAVNEEHTLWFDPETFAEVVERAGLEVSDFYWLKEHYKPSDLSTKERAVHQIASLFCFFRPYFSANFMCELRKRKQ